MDDFGPITIKKIPRSDSKHLSRVRGNETRRSSVPIRAINIQINGLSSEPLESSTGAAQSIDLKNGNFVNDEIDVFNFTYYGHITIDKRNVTSVFPWVAKRILKVNPTSREVNVQISKTKMWLTEAADDKITIQEHHFDCIYRLSRMNKCHMDDYLAYIITTKSDRAVASFHLLECNDQVEKNEFLNTLKTRVLGFQKVSLLPTGKNLSPQSHVRPTHKRGASSGAILVSPIKKDPVYEDSIYYIGKVAISQQQVPPAFIDNVLVRLKCSVDRRKSAGGIFWQNKLKALSFDGNAVGGISVQTSAQPVYTPPIVKKIPLTRKRSASVDFTEKQEALKDDVSALINGTESSSMNELSDEIDGSINDEVQSRLIKILLSKSSLLLFSLESQNLLFEKKIQNISFCTKGEERRDHFGFICREGGNHVCYIFQGESEFKVDVIMKAMKTAFAEALQASQFMTLCDTCPLQSLHKLCNLLEGTNSIAEKDGMVHETIKILSEYEQLHVLNEVNEEDPDNDAERIEITVNTLRELFDQKQLQHKHTYKLPSAPFSDAENKDSLKPMATSGLFEKARKSLTTSFQNFSMKKVRSKTILSFVGDIDNMNMPVSGPARETNNGNDFKPRSRSLENPYEASSELVHNKAKLELKFNSHVEATSGSGGGKASRGGSLEEVEKNVPEAVAEESRDQFNEETKSKTPVMGHRRIRRESSWRQAIYQSVVTPSRRSSSSSTVTLPGDNEENTSKEVPVDISARARSRWRSAIMNQILLIRMEKENKKLAANISATEIRRQKLSYQELCSFTAEAASAWDETLSNKTNERVEKQVLLDIIRGGVPRARRGEIWQYLIKQFTVSSPDSSEKQLWKETPYRTILKQNTVHQHAILIDLGRTFPTHVHFMPRLGSGQISLFNILKAYSLLDDEVGYCQGLSFVAGILLMHMSEEDAFKCFCHMMFDLQIRNQYKPDMNAVRQQLYQLSRLLHDYHPKVYAHFNLHDVTPTLYAAPWFLTLYASQYPIGFVSRVMDMVLLEGLEVIFKVALVLIGNHADEILECDSFESIVDYMKLSLPEKVVCETDDICLRALNMDINHQLNLYEVEYQLLNEEMVDIRQNKEKFDKQEQVLKEVRSEMQTMKRTLDDTNRTVQYLQSALDEANKKNKEYERDIERLTWENRMLRSQSSLSLPNDKCYDNNDDTYFNSCKQPNGMRDKSSIDDIGHKDWGDLEPSSPPPTKADNELTDSGLSWDGSSSPVTSDDSLHTKDT